MINVECPIIVIIGHSKERWNMSLSETDHSEKIYTWMEIDNLVRKLRTHTSHAPTYHIIDEAAKDIKTLNTVSIGELKKILYDYHRLIKLLF